MIRIDTSIEEIRIYIDDLLHLCLSRSSLVGVQSYIDSTSIYVIEYSLAAKTIKCEYESRSMWEEVLRQLNKIKPLFRS